MEFLKNLLETPMDFSSSFVVAAMTNLALYFLFLLPIRWQLIMLVPLVVVMCFVVGNGQYKGHRSTEEIGGLVAGTVVVLSAYVLGGWRKKKAMPPAGGGV